MQSSNGSSVFWMVLAIINALAAIIAFIIGYFGDKFGVGEYRRGRAKISFWLLLGWTSISLANYYIHNR